MKRSAINEILGHTRQFFSQHDVHLPPFASFPPTQWRKLDAAAWSEVFDLKLGWDVTAFGGNNFAAQGLTLFTLRNGSPKGMPYEKCYAEKIMHVRDAQVTPMHFHWRKREDIINRGGGNVLIRVYNSLPDESIDYTSDVTVHTDGRAYTVPAGTQIRLTPGESIYITQRLYHDFEVEPGTGDVLLGEVSQCNDDSIDNRFNPPMGRFPAIEEDEPPYRLLCTEYPAARD